MDNVREITNMVTGLTRQNRNLMLAFAVLLGTDSAFLTAYKERIAKTGAPLELEDLRILVCEWPSETAQTQNRDAEAQGLDVAS